MSLGKKTLALFLVLGCAICLGSYFALRLTVLPAFAEFERSASEQALERVTRMLDSELRALEIMNIEYSAWSDTYAYALGQYPAFEVGNLDPDYWHSVNIDAMLIFGQDGEVLFGRIGDPSDGHRLEFTEEFIATLRPGHPLITHKSPSSSLSGLILTRAGILQVTSYPILTSEGTGPVAGAFIVGQFLSHERIAELGKRATVEASVRALDDETLRAAVATLNRNADTADTTVVTYEDELHGYQFLRGALGEPIAVLEVRQPRAITQIGIKTIRAATTFLVIGSVGFLLAALFFIQQLIVTPVRMLTEKILNIQNTGELEMDVEAHRSDEVGVLAGKFSELTAGLGKARRELETARDEALSMSDAKSEFLARMSHEIRTPMNGVLGMTELLRNTELNDKQERFAKTIHESAESLLHIINDILDISKIEAGKVELDVAPFNLRDVVEECLELLADSAHRKDLELVGAIPGDVHTFVEGDALRLRQILVNLISNSVKFTEQGEIVLRVAALEEDADFVKYRFEVRDTGIGISAENLAKIFDPFAQEDGSTTRRYGGTGLGLSISKQLIELMGGEIGADCTQGQGCTFWFTVQLRKDVAELAMITPDLLAGKRVLIVDDNATNRETLRGQLEGWRMAVESACSGPEALEVLSRPARSDAPFDVVLLDMNMPDMDGIELSKTIGKAGLAGAAPLIMLSSVSGANSQNELAASGIVAWLTKPVRQTRLHDALVSHLSRTASESGNAGTYPKPVVATNDSAHRTLRILLAEDNPINKTVATGMLAELGHKTTVVANGNEAVDAFKRQDFDLVFMDCQMPELDGYEATQAIRQWENEQDRALTTIIALTANALEGDRERCLSAGMSDYISKPFTLAKLESVVDANTRQDHIDGQTDSADSSCHILIVDDNPINQQVAKAMMDEIGFSSDVVSNGDEALRALESTRFDLVLMDCHMPLRDGYDTTREVRKLEEEGSRKGRIPIVAVTADLMQNNRSRCLDCGMDDYLAKPFTDKQLRLVLSRWLIDPRINDPTTEVVVDSEGFTELSETATIASLDAHTFAEILRLDKSSDKNMTREIVVSYCALSTKLVLQLRAATADGDEEQIDVLAHSLKGCSGQIGAVYLANLCEKILSCVRDKDLSEAPSLCERAAIEHSAIITALDRELQRIAA